MPKKKYYVSLQAKTVTEHQGDAAYELEIEATPEDIEQLYELIDAQDEADLSDFFRLHSLDPIKDEVQPNEGFDYNLTEIYRLLHRLGTPETRSHIESMNVLQGIRHGYDKNP